MSKDLSYFDEFLADPAKYEFDEFHRWAKEWGRYLIDHKDEFNYLEDDEWKEIRERLLEVLHAREHEMDEVEDEWEQICEEGETVDDMNGITLLKFSRRRLKFMKAYKNYFNIPDEDIAEFEANINGLAKSRRDSELADLRVYQTKLNLENSVAELDEHLAEFYKRTGKILSVPVYTAKRKHKGN